MPELRRDSSQPSAMSRSNATNMDVREIPRLLESARDDASRAPFGNVPVRTKCRMRRYSRSPKGSPLFSSVSWKNFGARTKVGSDLLSVLPLRALPISYSVSIPYVDPMRPSPCERAERTPIIPATGRPAKMSLSGEINGASMATPTQQSASQPAETTYRDSA